jgi:hypothetical protein
MPFKPGVRSVSATPVPFELRGPQADSSRAWAKSAKVPKLQLPNLEKNEGTNGEVGKRSVTRWAIGVGS